MSTSLGKRKRRDEIEIVNHSEYPSSEDSDSVYKLFRQHFETKYEPLQVQPELSTTDERFDQDSICSGSLSSWNGLPDAEESNAEVVDHRALADNNTTVSKEEIRLFMSSKPPSNQATLSSHSKHKDPKYVNLDEAAADVANVKKDLALQRLIKESHLLEQDNSFAPSGKNRHKALDLRVQDLGSKSSIFTQRNMPLAQRKGILAKETSKEKTRRKEAKENGIILEKVSKEKRSATKRERSIGGPSVGKFRGGMLKLSKKDVANIIGPPKSIKARR